MKLAYSHLKELIPTLKASPEAVGEVLSLIGYMVDGVEKKKRGGKPDMVLSVELRQNRPDCQSLIGLSRELAAYYGLTLNLPKIKKIPTGKQSLKIGVESKAVRAIRALEVRGVKNGPSPKWLVEWLAVYDMKSISLLVDISNAVMLLTGYPSHIIDADKLEGNLRWSEAGKHKNFTTLDGSAIALSGKELLIADASGPIALAGIVGGTKAEVSLSTTNAIIEMAVYDPLVIRRDARNLNITTEAGIRLSRRLSVNGVDDAFAILIDLIFSNAKPQSFSKVFQYGALEKKSKAIVFDATAPTSFAGVEISEKKSIDLLKRLGCVVAKQGKGYKVVPPLFREDLEESEDLVEEVVRLVGFNTIPGDTVPALMVTRNLTPVSIRLKEWLRDRMRALGYDEILSQPLVARMANEQTNYMPWQAIETQNSVNEEFPVLRQSLLGGLLNQLEIYAKKDVAYAQIFEIGKIFGQERKAYSEYDAMAALLKTDKPSLHVVQSVLESLLLSLGVANICFDAMAKAPMVANPHAAWTVKTGDMSIGSLMALKPVAGAEHIYAFEVYLEALQMALKSKKTGAAVYELKNKIVALDVTIELKGYEQIAEKVAEIGSRINEKNLWDISVIDEFKLPNSVRYTFRISYKDLSDQEAKELHGKIFS